MQKSVQTAYAKISTNRYTVTYVLGFEPEEGEEVTVPTQDSVNFNGTFTVKAAPTRQAYLQFAGWSDGVELYQEDDVYTVENAGNIVLTGVWNVIEHAVNFFDENGEQIGNTVYVPHGCAAVAPFVSHTLSVFQFEDWDQDISYVTEDMNVNALFKYVPAANDYFDFVPVMDGYNVVAYKVKFAPDRSSPYYNPDPNYEYNAMRSFDHSGLWGFPDYYRDLPVIGFAGAISGVGMDYSGRYPMPFNDFSVYIPDTFESLGLLAIDGWYVDTVYIGSGLNNIDKHAFNQSYIKAWVVSEENEHFSSDGPTLYNKDKTVMITTYRDVSQFIVPVGIDEIYPNFLGCSYMLQSVIIEGDVKIVGDGAFGNTGLTEFIINGSIERLEDSLNAGDPDYVFTYPLFPTIGSYSLTNLYLKGIKYIGFGALTNCALDELILDTTLEHLDHEALANLEMLTSIKFANNATVSDNGKYVIQNNTVIEKGTSSIMLEDGVTPGDIFILYASYCDDVTEYVVPNTVREFAEWAFCKVLLEEVTLPDGIEALSGGMFYYAENMKSLTIPSSLLRFELTDESHGTNGCGNYSPLEGCWIESIIFPNDCKITEFPDLLFYKTHLKTIDIPESVTSIGEGVFSTGWLRSITAPETHEYFTTIDGILYNKDVTELIKYPTARSNESYTLPDTIVAIVEGAASGSSYLKHLVINEGLQELSAGCFAYSGLETVSISSTIESIDVQAFEWCHDMREMEFKSTTPPEVKNATGVNLFGNMDIDFKGRMVFKIAQPLYDDYYTWLNENSPSGYNYGDHIDVSQYPDEHVTKYVFMDGEDVYQTIKAKKLRDYPVPEPKTAGETTMYFVGWYSEPGFVNEITLPWTPVVNDDGDVITYYAKWSATPRRDGSAPAFAILLPFNQDMTITITKANSVLFFRSEINFQGQWNTLWMSLYINDEYKAGMSMGRGLMENDQYSLNAIDFDSFLHLAEDEEVTITFRLEAGVY